MTTTAIVVGIDIAKAELGALLGQLRVKEFLPGTATRFTTSTSIVIRKRTSCSSLRSRTRDAGSSKRKPN
jgi:hypothetical protein